MTTLLHIEVSPMGDNSVSRQVSAEFLTAWASAHPDGTIVTRDLSVEPVPHLDGESIFAGYVPADSHAESMAAKHAYRHGLIEQISHVDEIVISTPMWNYSVPSVLKAYIDHVIMPGTFDGTADGLAGKKVTFIIAQGGSYKPGTPREGWDFASGYLELFAKSLSATDISVILAELTLAGVVPGMDDLIGLKEASIAEAKNEAAARATA